MWRDTECSRPRLARSRCHHGTPARQSLANRTALLRSAAAPDDNLLERPAGSLTPLELPVPDDRAGTAACISPLGRACRNGTLAEACRPILLRQLLGRDGQVSLADHFRL
jgi:hypothetical protein